VLAVIVYVSAEDPRIEAEKSLFINQPKTIVIPFFLNQNYWTHQKYNLTFDVVSELNTLEFEHDNVNYTSEIQFIDSLEGTNIKWKTNRNLHFIEKFNRLFFGENKKAELTTFIGKELNACGDSLHKKTNEIVFEIAGLHQFSQQYIIERDTLISKENKELTKDKMLTQIKLIAFKNKLVLVDKPFYHISKNGQNIRLKIQNKVAFDSLWISELPIYVKSQPEFQALKINTKGVIKDLKLYQNKIELVLDSLELTQKQPHLYLEKDIINSQNTPMRFEWISEIFIPVVRKDTL